MNDVRLAMYSLLEHNFPTDESILEHHGVPGMRWGVRRAASRVSRGINNRLGARSEARRKTKDLRLQMKIAKRNFKQQKQINKLQKKTGATIFSAPARFIRKRSTKKIYKHHKKLYKQAYRKAYAEALNRRRSENG